MIDSIKYLQEGVVFLKTLLREKSRWRARTIVTDERNLVYYGYPSLSTSCDVSSGGVVKTQDLITVFPNTTKNPNILYLISSALPPYAPRMAQIARKAGAKVVLNQNGVAYPAWHGAGWERTNRFMSEVLGQADYVFYQSEFCKRGADQFLQKYDGKSEVLYNPVNTEYFFPPTSKPAMDPVKLLIAGSHTHFYRVKCAVDTLKHLRDDGINTKLEIAGRYCWNSDLGSATTELLHYITHKSLTEHVILSGPYTQEEGRDVFRRSHVLVHTKYNDPCPRLVVEGMASGLPVVYSASGGTPELVGSEAGVGIPAPVDLERDHPPAPDQLAEGVKLILRSYEHYSRAARNRAVDNFDSQPWLSRHGQIFSQLTKGTHNEE
ncbi:MAG: glycosyltransferase involved in cell wall biosynthesis [Desulforhopalus sp.]|jgi:glycosyltransferase involved in cell wall biosynthesis